MAVSYTVAPMVMSDEEPKQRVFCCGKTRWPEECYHCSCVQDSGVCCACGEENDKWLRRSHRSH